MQSVGFRASSPWDVLGAKSAYSVSLEESRMNCKQDLFLSRYSLNKDT